jgi:ring-1,2-phenylacetyl-CoA epoxidase subunit PaaC
MLVAINELWRYTGEMFIAVDYEKEMNIDLIALQNNWAEKVDVIFQEATLSIPQNTFMQTGGKTGTHTENLGFILTELQYMQRAYPNSQW